MSDTSPPFPPRVYKILSGPPISPLPHTLPSTTLDAHDGFIHLSTAWRTPQTASMYFSSDTALWLLRIDVQTAQAESAEFKWGDPGCVHLYNGRLGEGVVVSSKEVNRADGETWEDVLGNDEWLSD
ncbi:hypothetical protein FA95DRAFT_1503068 [Auriscalpium vulgare]|uniref:Uncharacterized protein n=1 Tax=Auriscalpium vulgare TaxID=40419 RepID=A0ACB8R9L1_9AGAM|nr:hypothetical protein FA95DRAFT_1503068 [Auriscalpium vulgare]